MQFFARKSITRLRRMLQAIRMGEFSMNFSTKGLRRSEKKLVEEMNEIISEIREDIVRREQQCGRYEAILNIVDSALIIADGEGKIDWMNKKAIDGLCGFMITNLSMLDVLNPELTEALKNLCPGYPRIVSLIIKGIETRLRLSVASYLARGKKSYIYSIENVNFLMQQSEAEAQRKLVSVLTHEIMNSLSPIISLSDTLCGKAWSEDEDAVLAIKAINRRSTGLLKFVENYRILTRISSPSVKWTRIGTLFEILKALFPDSCISFDLEDPDIQLQLDINQMEQVMINLIKNAVEACGDSPQVVITTKADHPNHQFIISVEDNGCGISKDAIDNIFVPFFTTKQNGSGIGLSLSRQIVNMHGGIIRVESSSEGSIFSIILPLVYRI